MPRFLSLMMEVAGCPTSCMHCSARGGHYAAMPLSEMARVLDKAHRFCEANHLGFDAFPLHDALGTTTFWFALHGIGETHDRIVNRDGAYEDSCCAIKRVSSMGFNCGCNVFVSKANLGQIDDLMEALPALGIRQTRESPRTLHTSSSA